MGCGDDQHLAKKWWLDLGGDCRINSHGVSENNGSRSNQYCIDADKSQDGSKEIGAQVLNGPV